MRPPVSVCSNSKTSSTRAASHIHRQLAQHAHMLGRGIRCSVPAPLQSACYSTATRRQHVILLSHAPRRTCSLGSISWLPHHQHAGASDGSGRQLTGRRWPQHRGRQSGRDAVQPTLAAAGSGSAGGQSMDDDEEGDAGVTRELEGYEVERFRQMGRHLDLMWNVGKKPRPAPCDCCEGSGSRHCGYCNSTGAMMVGHERFCSLEQGCKPCPICNGTGEVKCSHCQGTGYRAGWLEPGCPVEQ